MKKPNISQKQGKSGLQGDKRKRSFVFSQNAGDLEGGGRENYVWTKRCKEKHQSS
ncbi:hypothetical protein I79_018484 [Cricetulus griseus]|uniref:Uncharacterized protein n=1 Tax=Cricetulus griseus TaxID=10029 RepID=G3I4U6_CRIGR|nr:hypothetical protein I79_018484 [Cricetulus griseus]